MLSRKSFLVIAVTLLFAGNFSMAVMCARLKSVSAGEDHTLALADDNTLWAWGTDNYGQLGNGTWLSHTDVPQRVHGIDDVNYLSDTVDIVYVSAGRSGEHSLAVDANGYVCAWGRNGFGQCGIGSIKPIYQGCQRIGLRGAS